MEHWGIGLLKHSQNQQKFEKLPKIKKAIEAYNKGDSQRQIKQSFTE
jgi:hypothetical protein